MSRSNKTVYADNPTEARFDWSGSEGIITFYDKEKSEKVKVPFPFKIAILDELHCITGYSNDLQQGIWSNEIKDFKSQDLKVFAGPAQLMCGKYAEIKDKAKSNGGKYTKSVYFCLFSKKGARLCNMKLRGAAFSAYINFTQGKEEYKGKGKVKVLETGIQITGPSGEKKKGATKYFEPVFETFALTPEEEEQALEMDKTLQAYLAQYLVAKVDETHVETHGSITEEPVAAEVDPFEDDLPF